MSSIGQISSASSPAVVGSGARIADRPQPVEVQVIPARVDTVDLSERARLLDSLRAREDVRTELVDRIRGEIDAGTYLTDDKLDQALDALIDDVLS